MIVNTNLITLLIISEYIYIDIIFLVHISRSFNIVIFHIVLSDFMLFIESFSNLRF